MRFSSFYGFVSSVSTVVTWDLSVLLAFLRVLLIGWAESTVASSGPNSVVSTIACELEHKSNQFKSINRQIRDMNEKVHEPRTLDYTPRCPTDLTNFLWDFKLINEGLV